MHFWVKLPVPRFIRTNPHLLAVWRVVMFVVLTLAASSAATLLFWGCASLVE